MWRGCGVEKSAVERVCSGEGVLWRVCAVGRV